jgi:hypothetical protein
MEKLANLIEEIEDNDVNVDSEDRLYDGSYQKKETLSLNASDNSIGQVLNSASSVSKEQVMKELDNIANNPEAIEKMIGKMGSDKELAKMMKDEKKTAALASDPKMRRMAEDAKKNITRKQALKMNKAINKGLNKQASNRPKMEGVLINISKKIKPYSADKGSLEQIGRSLNAQTLKSIEINQYIIYYDLRAPNNNRKIQHLFPTLQLANQVIVFNKDFSPLSVDDFSKIAEIRPHHSEEPKGTEIKKMEPEME